VEGEEVTGVNTRIDLRFSTNENEEVMIKVGLSSANIDGAIKAIETEAAHWDFEKFRADASDMWERELQKIIIETDNETWKRTFYTTLYQSMLAPTLYSDATAITRAPTATITKPKDTINTTHSPYGILSGQPIRSIP
jgi:putative alpha-1,2-mannosidase